MWTGVSTMDICIYHRERLMPDIPDSTSSCLIGRLRLPGNHEVQRAYADFHGCPGYRGGAAYERWSAGKQVYKAKGGEFVLVTDEIHRCANVLFFPRRPGVLEWELIRLATEYAFAVLNLHRLQTCLPSGVESWRSSLLREGFIEEGR